MNKEKENLGVIVERIATKYAKLVENRIDAIQVVATMERFGRMESAD